MLLLCYYVIMLCIMLLTWSLSTISLMFLFWPRAELIVHVLTQSVLVRPKPQQKYCVLSNYTQKGQFQNKHRNGLVSKYKIISRGSPKHHWPFSTLHKCKLEFQRDRSLTIGETTFLVKSCKNFAHKKKLFGYKTTHLFVTCLCT